MNDKKEGLEDLLQYIMGEIFRKGFPPGAAGRASRDIEDIMNMIRNFKNRNYASSFSEEANPTDEVLKTEIEVLKEQIALLKQQLKDKEEIIALLKEKIAARQSGE